MRNEKKNPLSHLFVATKGFIVHEGKVLVVRESTTYSDGTLPGVFGLVGGRMNPDENVEESLHREIREETGLTVILKKPLWVSEWRPVVRNEQWHIVGIFFVCTSNTAHVTLGPDHSFYKWIVPANYHHENIVEDEHAVFEAYLTK
ncbi:MAG: NUDIX domain-containing protein [Patescibacteria group bacterium]|jgi:8-oxo-dGTP diphosphatase